MILASALVFGTTGCTFITSQATLNQYDPSDGISGRVGWRLAPDWLLGFEAGHASSSLNNAGGYRRTSASVDIRAYF